MKDYSFWTPEEDAIIKASSGMTCAQLMELLPDRDKRSIERRRRRIMGGEPLTRLWTPEDDAAMLHLLSLGFTIRRIADELDRSEAAVRSREALLNKGGGRVKKADPWPDLSPDAFKDVKVSADPAVKLTKPQDRTLAGVGTVLLVA